MMLESLIIYMAQAHTHTHKESRHRSYTFHNINSKHTTHLNVKYKTVKFLESNTGENLDDLGYADNFLDIVPQVRCMKEIIHRLDFIKVKNIYSTKNTLDRMRRQSTE